MPRVFRKHDLVKGERWQPLPLAYPESESLPASLAEDVLVDPPLDHEYEIEAEPSPEVAPDPNMIAAAIIQEAEEQAAAILKAAEGDADAIRVEAREAGLAMGRDMGHQEYAALIAERTASIDALVDEINRERHEFFQRAEGDLIRLVVGIAEKVIQQQLTLNPEIIVELTRAHTKRIREREVLRVRVHPDDLPTLQVARERLMTEIDGVREIQFLDDRRVGPGGLVFETDHGSLDARIAPQLDIIGKVLEEAQEVHHDPAND